MEMDNLKQEILKNLSILDGSLDNTRLKKWVSINEEQPKEKGYYITLGLDSNPNFIYTCRASNHYWDTKEWSSETRYWLKDVEIKIDTYKIDTAMGTCGTKLPFLTEKEFEEFNSIGYSGKTTNGIEIGREEYLNSLNKGKFEITKTKYDRGDFRESFIITHIIY